DHGDADELADLRRGDADAPLERAHRVGQVGRDLPCVEVGADRLASLLENRVGIAEDVTDRHYRTSTSISRTETSTPSSAATSVRRSSISSVRSSGTAA